MPRREDEDDQRRRQPEQAAVAHDFDAENGQVTADCAGHDRQREHRSDRRGRRHQEQNRGDELHDARQDPSPGFNAQRREDVDRFRRTGEFEEEGLEQEAQS